MIYRFLTYRLMRSLTGDLVKVILIVLAFLLLGGIALYWLLPDPPKETPKPATIQAAYAFPDTCGLADVVCPEEEVYSTKEIIYAIAKFETRNGTDGSRSARVNNPTGIGCNKVCWSYPTLEEGYAEAMALWDRSYKSLDLETALAKWKVTPTDRSEATLRYIRNIKGELQNGNQN